MNMAVIKHHRGAPILGSAIDLFSDPPKFFAEKYEKYGEVFSFNIASSKVIAIFDPDLISEMLVTKHQDFIKNRVFYDNVKEVLGNGLLTNEGESWKTQRKLASPSFRPRSVSSYIDSMIELSEAEVSTWINGSRIDAHNKMMSLTAEIITKIIFNTSTGGKGKKLLEAIVEAEHLIPGRCMRPHPIIHKLPIPSNFRYQKCLDILETEVMSFISEAKESETDYPTLLSNLMNAKYDDGSSMEPKQLRDEIINIFLAGHDTTAITLSFTFYLLSQNPDVEKKMTDELDSVIGDGPLNATMLDKLTYTKKVIKESMRFMPATWGFGREAAVDTTLGEHKIKKGTSIYISPFQMHRIEKYFDAPLEFKPERWTEEFTKSLPKHVYSPFGGGPRVCIGEHLSLTETLIILATVYKNCRLVYEDSKPPELVAAAVLTPKNGMPMAVFRR